MFKRLSHGSDRWGRVLVAGKTAAALGVVALLAACGGGGGSSGSSGSGGSGGSGGGGTVSYAARSTYADQCAAPRASAITASGAAKVDRVGSLATEMNWVRSFINDTYLWYSEVGDISSTGYATPVAYFNVLKTTGLSASGAPKDKFHFTYDTASWVQESVVGTSYSYGVDWALLASRPPRSIVASSVDAGTPAAAAGLTRGTKLISVDGVDVATGSDTTTLNEGTWPSKTVAHTLGVMDVGSSVVRYVTLTPTTLATKSVKNVGMVPGYPGLGYMNFTTHIRTSEADLIAAVNQLKTAGATDLVLDLRYNGGGYLDVAAGLAYMIAGPAQTTGKIFEKITFNDKNPFGATAADTTTPFWSTTQFSTPSQSLPTLNLNKVYVLTSAHTCSASEAIINGLRGVGVTVNLVGGQTCGKPYGFIPEDNCGTTYFAIQFKGVNNVGYGDYSDGFTPTCAATDDFTKQLGDPTEGQLAVALRHRTTGSCTGGVGVLTPYMSTINGTNVDGPEVTKPFSPLQSAKIYRR